MKRMLTLLFALGIMTVSFAQRGYDNNSRRDRDVVYDQRNVYGNNRYDRYSMSPKERDSEIKRLNKEFDAKIKAVRKDRRLRSSEKNYQIDRLSRQRDWEIQQVRDRYASSRNTYNDRYARNDRRW